VLWLDGMRGAAAVFVVFHHMWLAVWPGFPSDNGPWFLGGLLYGHLAVALFIVVSGVSLALVPLSEGSRLRGGMRQFVRRRAWRILPAYWVALIFSTIVTGYLLSSDEATTTIAKAFVVHGLLLQDIVGSQSPNGAFWSIAVEWQIYFAFPVILLVARKKGLGAAVGLTLGVVVAGHLLAQLGAPFKKIDDLTPQFLALFALGILAVSLGRSARHANLRRPLGAISLMILAAFVVFAVVAGPEWMVAHYFYVDLVVGAGVACLVATILMGGAAWARRLLASRVGLRVGLFSYSIYLIHGPILAMLATWVIRPSGLTGVPEFALFLAIGLPLVLAVSYGFHLLFEAPFLRYRDMRSLRALPIARIRLPRRSRVTLPEIATADER
jgi:peptidoglycan/LPS O-acetylase OafA/YrhL